MSKGATKDTLWAAVFVVIAGVITHIVGMATPQWLVCEYYNKTCYFDIWNNHACDDEDIKSVDPYDGEFRELLAVRVFICLALVTGVAAIPMAIIFSTVWPDEPFCFKFPGYAMSATFSFNMIAAGVFGFAIYDDSYGNATDTRPQKQQIEDSFHLGYSYFLCLAAGISMALSIALFGKWLNRGEPK